MYLRSLLLLSSVVTLEQALPQNSADKRPSFGDYQVKPTFHGRPADPVLNTEFSNRFRTHIRDAAARGPNFAGHYVLADWCCGSACIQVAVIDAESGAVYEGPFRTLIYDNTGQVCRRR